MEVEMKVKTRDFGEIEVDDRAVIRFEDGLPGFPEEKELFLIEDDEDNTIKWLQSVNNEETVFPVMDVYQVCPEYNPLAEKDELDDIGSINEECLEIVNILTVPEDFKRMSVNLRAPIVINHKTKKGKQIILNNDDYEVRHFLYDKLKSRW